MMSIICKVSGVVMIPSFVEMINDLESSGGFEITKEGNEWTIQGNHKVLKEDPQNPSDEFLYLWINH